MERYSDGKVKVVWIEGNEPHCVIARQVGEADDFVKFALLDGRTVLLQRSMIVKIEEVL